MVVDVTLLYTTSKILEIEMSENNQKESLCSLMYLFFTLLTKLSYSSATSIPLVPGSYFPDLPGCE